MLGQGLRPRSSVCTSAHVTSKDTIVFCPIAPQSGEFDTLIIMFDNTDALLFSGDISSTEETCIQDAFKQWPYQMKKASFVQKFDAILDPGQTSYYACFEGHPWGVFTQEVNHGKMVLQTLFSSLRVHGWTLLMSSDLSDECYTGDTSAGGAYDDEKKDLGYHYSLGCHTFFLIKNKAEKVVEKVPDEPQSDEVNAEQTQAEEFIAEDFMAEIMKTEVIKVKEIMAEEINAKQLENEESKAEELENEEVKNEEPEAEEVIAEEPKVEETQAEESKAEELEDEEIKTEEPEAEEVKAAEPEVEVIKVKEIIAEEVKSEEIETEDVKADKLETESDTNSESRAE